MTDYKKIHALEDLDRISKMISTLADVYTSRKNMDNKSLKIVNGLYNTIQDIYTQEMKNELTKQKKEGKQFLTDKEIDDLVEKILKEENHA